MGLPHKNRMNLTFNAAADGSSGSPKNGFVFSMFKLFVCLVLTSPMLNTTGPDTPKHKYDEEKNPKF